VTRPTCGARFPSLPRFRRSLSAGPKSKCARLRIHRIPEFRIGGTLLDEIWPAHDLFEGEEAGGLGGDGDREIKRASGAPRRTPYAGFPSFRGARRTLDFPHSEAHAVRWIPLIPSSTVSRWADLRCTFPSLHRFRRSLSAGPKSKSAPLLIHDSRKFGGTLLGYISAHFPIAMRAAVDAPCR
jgi:hypothetical protein